jgi:hypothetical protein
MSPLLIVHIATGSLGILCGAAAVAVRKGETRHRAFGTVFFVSMLIMSALGAYAAVGLPQNASASTPPKASVAVGILTFYLVATAWMTVRRKDQSTGPFEIGALLVSLGAATALLCFGVHAAISPPARPKDYAPYFVFASFAAFAAVLDLNVILRGGVIGAPRLARHLWRMCFALFFAAAFFFLGQQKVMPAFMRGSPILTALALAPLAMMVFWLYRVRRAGRF